MKLVFVSSTFKDMQFERDRFHSHVVPLLDAKLEERGEAVYFGDLRWGVNTSDLDSDASNKKVLSVCLDEIDSCKPFMIVLIGERYGWIPGEELIKQACLLKGIDVDPSISVTHLEIEYGALLRPEYRGRVIFYFRELDKTGMTDAEKKDYEAESPLHAAKMKELKDKINELYPEQVRTYKAKWDPVTKSVVDLDPLMEMVSRDLEAAFDLDEEPFKNLPWQEKALHAADGYFMQEGARDLMDYIDFTISVGDPINHRSTVEIFRGHSGVGKTAYLRYEYQKDKSSGHKYEAAGFVYGLDPYSRNPFNMMRMMLYKLEQMTGEEHQFLEDEVDEDAVIKRIAHLAYKTKYNLIFYVDNGDQDILRPLYRLFGDFDYQKYDDMMLHDGSSFEHGLYVKVAYRKSNEPILVPPFARWCSIFEIGSVTEGKELNFINAIAKEKHKEISEVVAKEIIKREMGDTSSIYHGSRDPLYYRLITERLLMLDSEDFANIRKMGDGMDNINKYMLSIVDNFDKYATGLARDLMKEAAERIDQKFVYRLFMLLYAVRDYIPEKQIEYAFSKMGWEFSTLNFSLLTKSFGYLFSKRPVDNAYQLMFRYSLDDYRKTHKEEENAIIAFLKSEKDIHAFYFKYKLSGLVSFSSEKEFVTDALLDIYDISKTLTDQKDILDLRKSMAMMMNELVTRLLVGWEIPCLLNKKRPDVNFSFILDFIPTAYLFGNFDRSGEYRDTHIFFEGLTKDLELDNDNAKSLYLTAIAKAIKIDMANGLPVTEMYHQKYEEVANQCTDVLAELKARLAIVRDDIYQGRSFLYSADDLYDQLYIEHALDNRIEKQYYETIYKTQVDLVFARFLADNEIDVERANNIVFNAFNKQLSWGFVKDETVLRLISFDDVHVIVKEFMSYFKNHRLEEHSQNYLMTICRFVQIAAKEVGSRAYALLADIMEGVIQFQAIDNELMMIDAQYLAIEDVRAKRFWISKPCCTDIAHADLSRAMAELALHLMDQQINPTSQEFNDKYLNLFKGGISHTRQLLDHDRDHYLFYDVATSAFYISYYYVIYGKVDAAYSLYSYISSAINVDDLYMPQFGDFVVNAFHYLFGYDQANVKNLAINDYNALIATEDGQAILEKHRGLVEAILGMFGF